MPLWSQSFRLYAIDMIGEAGFSSPSRPDLHVEAHALWLDDVLQGLGLTHAAFVGLSLGGWMALDYAKRRPSKVDRTRPDLPSGNWQAEKLPAQGGAAYAAWTLRRAKSAGDGVRPGAVELPAIVRPLADLMGLIGRSFRPRVMKIPLLADDELARLDVPILAIIGGKDVLIDSAETRDSLARNAPQADVRFLPAARHFIPGQGETVLQFLSERVTP